MQHDLSERTCGIWDLDNTLIPDLHPDGFSFSAYFPKAFQDVAQALFPTLDDENITHHMDSGFFHFGTSFLGFQAIAEEYGYDLNTLYEALHENANRLWLERITQNHPDGIRPCPRTVSLFDSLSSHVRHGCLTHSSPEHWARPVLTQLGIIQFFSQILGLPDYGFMPKPLSTRGLETILGEMVAEPHEAFFAEDSLRNLEKAKDLSPHLLTVLVHYGRPPDRLPAYVDLAVENPVALLSALNEAHLSAKPKKIWTPATAANPAPY